MRLLSLLVNQILVMTSEISSLSAYSSDAKNAYWLFIVYSMSSHHNSTPAETLRSLNGGFLW